MGQPEPPNPNVDQMLNQYEFYAGTAEKVTDRRNDLNRFYISIHTGLLTLLTLVGGFSLIVGPNGSSGAQSTSHSTSTPFTVFLQNGQGEIGIFLCLLGAAISLIWMVNISQYRKLNTAKYDVITDMEKKLPFQAFADEWRILMGGPRPSGRPIKRYREVTRIETFLPIFAIVVYLVVAAGFGFGSGMFQAFFTIVSHL